MWYFKAANGCSIRDSQAHRFWCCPSLHTFQRLIVQMLFQQTTRTHRAPRSQRTSTADSWLTSIDDIAIFSLMTMQPLTRRAEERIAALVVLEIAARKQRAVSAIVHSTNRRYVRDDPLILASLRLLSAGVARIGHNIEGVPGHPNAACAASAMGCKPIIRGFVAYLLPHNQRRLGIHRRLHVVGRNSAIGGPHEASFSFRMLAQLLQRGGHGFAVDFYFFLLIGLLHLS